MRTRRRLTGRVAAGIAVLSALALVPRPSVDPSLSALVTVDGTAYVDHDPGVIWVLALGSDARVENGENPLRTRADAIQLVAIDVERRTASIIGVPRDSYVPIPGVGSDRINAALYYGGPQLMAKAVGDLVGVRPDYVFLATFGGLEAMVDDIGGVTVRSDMSFTDDGMEGEIKAGRNRVDGSLALFFARARHFLPRGDFDRSAHQQELLEAILREAHAHAGERGFFEQGVWTAAMNLRTDLSPVALYRLAKAAAGVDPRKVTSCVLPGSIADVNGASVVLPDVAAARRMGQEARNDATLDTPC